MFKQQKMWWTGASVLILLLLALNFLSFRATQSMTEANHSLSTYRAGEMLPASMAPGFTLSFAVTGEEPLAEALATALQPALEAHATIGRVALLSAPAQNTNGPFLLVVLTPDRLWTPFYSRATVNAHIYFACDGDAPWPLDEPVVLEVSPALKANGEFTLIDTTWGLVSKPAYTQHLAQALAREIATALQRDVLRNP